jgi:hypothetical protein
MLMEKKGKSLNWFAVAKCVSYVGFVITKNSRRLTTYESLLETEKRQTRIEEV